ncbi:hypothetical protein PC41400_13735 [Paenibacillus chitinolyticus]|uniref:Uncharacterized protein n=1 Tax=Paenibacillus chitinolyticus TaxID=79263 RepID=A0A410WWH2_9BACL|nr:DUF6886 family protein [Paenibacillus chitinolyticus]MCY9593246.1 hypothetical protein [Paenibacillus chitinolyticus]MCY9597696.1 hypothetical protein [Paenibacillus chitinolyticus]QAV18683.1 hypothetical protein PC41400_13735 [Paenibacillus chitinolyticus]
MLYHFSEEPDIPAFLPRKPQGCEDLPPVVWAVDEGHAHLYYFPRECPRIVYTLTGDVGEEDKRLLFGPAASDTVIAIESAWLERLRQTVLYRYTFEERDFRLLDATAGYYTAEEPVTPVSVEPVGDLLDKLAATGAELRIVPNLNPLRDALLASSVSLFSVIRFRNAQPPE